ncbi:TetR/AcrR family transcriptional regulator [Actinoallomurus rhizosphaericola]|uniref:TetR/AcrR family transcriptional regulator n=1 Tax=Actinoallomurus rhizosphaericola TaxID=2952536 RepID=UPI002093090A|nr:TetR/AcrR family transcriptional regulator [Actinoallomurus rhizosphaericola]MCO6000109.1 TetR/AcrR family transcriptional regulator [Actinoallomurus rhizosphaericola]
MSSADTPSAAGGRRKRSDARRNAQTLLDAAAAVFARAGIDAPVRDIAAEAGVGMGTVYRHFPTRPDLVVAVFRHQVDALAATPAGASGEDPEAPYEVLRAWVARFTDFLVTKHGLPEALHSDQAGLESLHAEFVDRLVPVLDRLLRTAADAGQIRVDVRPLDLMIAIGNLCIGADTFPGYRARHMVDVLLAGLLHGAPASTDADRPRTPTGP